VKKLLVAVILVAIIGVGAYTYYSRSHTVEYVTARVERGDIEASISATGNCNAVVTVQVGSQVSGNIVQLFADFNTKVTKNQLVARIEPTVFQARVDSARASLDAANAGVVNAQANLKRSDADIANAQANVSNLKANVLHAQSAVNDAKTKLARRLDEFKQGIIAKEDEDTAQATYDQAVASLEAAQAQAAAAQANVVSVQAQKDVAVTQLSSAQAQVKQVAASLQQAQIDLDHTEIRAPVDGTVIARNMDIGQTVAASFSAPTIFQIAQDLTKMQVDANIDESDVGRVMDGQQVSFTVDAYPGTTFHGAVTQIRKAPINVQNVITYDVVIHVDNPDLKLFPGMTANVRIATDKLTGVLKVPAAALRFRPPNVAATPAQAKGGGQGKGRAIGQQVIYVLDDQGKPKPVRVRLGIGDGNFSSVQGGDLKEGDMVITAVASANNPASAAPFPGQQKGKGPGF
jgi:HlyD family secretion protein